MARRVCAEPGCPTIVDQSARGGRCDTHRRDRERDRGTASARGYGAAHQRIRAGYQQRMDRGEHFTCWRCLAERGLAHDVDPSDWHLGHDDNDRTTYRGPECPAGNLAVAARRISPDG